MVATPFRTEDGRAVPAVTAEQMREVDRIAVEEFGLSVLQMMENAGRNLAGNALDMLSSPANARVTVLAGSGGNGGGGLCCARHLHNRDIRIQVILDRQQERLTGAARNQMRILHNAGIQSVHMSESHDVLKQSHLVVDALIGYGLRGPPQGHTGDLIAGCNEFATQVLSLDVPSGMNATTGVAAGVVVHADRTLTLALPKTGLKHLPGDLNLADIGIPPELYHQLGLTYTPFREDYWLRLITDTTSVASDRYIRSQGQKAVTNERSG